MQKNDRLLKTVMMASMILAAILWLAYCKGTTTDDNDNSSSGGTTSSSDNTNDNSSSSGTSSADNTNDNSSSSRSVNNANLHASVIEPQVIGICRVFADKIVLLCNNHRDRLTEWHLKAFSDKDAFMADCIADETFEGLEKEGLDTITDNVNDANECERLLNSLVTAH